MPSDAPTIDPETLERLRRGVPLRMTATGALRFDDEPVTHRGVARALRNGLDVTERGEPIVRLGPQWCYLTIDDCPLRATAIRRDREGDTLWMRLDDGREVVLPPQTLWDEPGHGLRAEAPSRHSGRALAVRLDNRARMDLEPWLQEDEAGSIGLQLGGRRWSLESTPPATAGSRSAAAAKAKTSLDA